jgi:two-component system cell cycle response regulator
MKEKQQKNKVLPDAPLPKPYTVVVVDDSTTSRTVIKRELEQAGYAVITFRDGVEALASLRWMTQPPDLITLDIDMPRMNGFDCCEKIREMEAQGLLGNGTTQLPVLFVSANDSLENRSRGFHLGSLEFISKPFARGEITAAVHKVLRPQTIFSGMTALVVDDNPSLRKMVGSCLERIGLQVLEAGNGRDAYAVMQENLGRIDLVIVDFDMPIMRGDEFIHLARQLPETEHLPMLSLSGAGDAHAVLRMFRAGATDYLVKPFIAEELLARMQVHLQLRRHVCRLEEINRNLYEKAVNDELTGLRNKQYFQEAFEEAFARAERIGIDLSCLFFDLDHFKQVNDTCGHGFGDYVLKTVGGLLKKTVRQGDLAARFGGEEFVVVLPNTNLIQAKGVAEKIRSLIAAYLFSDQGQQRRVTVSIGLASLHTTPTGSAAELLQQADQALYRAKRMGRDRVEAANS